jgi:hypothetical protein
MPSHFSTIGIPLKPQQDELSALAQKVAKDCVRHDTENGCYLQWSSPSGAVLWLQLDPANNLIGMDPHYSGQSRITVGLLQRVVRPGCTELEGAFYGWAKPEEEDIRPPESTAIFTGHVLEVQTRTNELTGKGYYWAFVETLCATFDVLIDPELLDHAPKAGNVLSGTFWLSGRIYK